MYLSAQQVSKQKCSILPGGTSRPSRNRLGFGRGRGSVDSFKLKDHEEEVDVRTTGELSSHEVHDQFSTQLSRNLRSTFSTSLSLLRFPSKKSHTSSHAGSSSAPLSGDIEEGLMRQSSSRKFMKHRR
jgi:hypothetical protein